MPVTTVLDRPAPAPLELTLHPVPDPGAPVLLVVPAMGLRASFYAPLLTALADAGVAAAVTGLRGHQARPAPPPGRRNDFGYEDLVGDLAAAVEAVRTARPGAPVFVVGHSLGGHLAAAYAARHPDRIDGVALVASGSVDWRVWGLAHLLRTQAVVAASTLIGHFPGDRIGFAGREARGQMCDWAGGPAPGGSRSARRGSTTPRRSPRCTCRSSGSGSNATGSPHPPRSTRCWPCSARRPGAAATSTSPGRARTSGGHASRRHSPSSCRC